MGFAQGATGRSHHDHIPLTTCFMAHNNKHPQFKSTQTPLAKLAHGLTCLQLIQETPMNLKSLFAAAAIALASVVATALPSAAEDATARGFDVTDERINGTWSIETREDGSYFVLHDDFSTKSGPDLKIFLSKQDVNKVRGRTATNNAVRVSPLKRSSGAQEYKLPDDVNLDDYTSVLIHCEQYSHFWGGANL